MNPSTLSGMSLLAVCLTFGASALAEPTDGKSPDNVPATIVAVPATPTVTPPPAVAAEIPADSGHGAFHALSPLNIVLSLVMPEPTRKRWYLIGDETLSLTPQVGSNGTGLTAVGHF